MPWTMMTTLKCQASRALATSQGARPQETWAPTQHLKRSSLPRRRSLTLCCNGWDKPTDQLIASRTMFPKEDTIDVGSVADLIGLTNVTPFLNPSRTLQSRNGVKCVSGISPMKQRTAIDWEGSSQTWRIG